MLIGKKKFLIFIFIFVLTFVLCLFFPRVYADEIWIYGFCYNISKGMVIYRDFNTVIAPFYFFLGSFFVKIFGNYLFSLLIMNSLLISFMMIWLIDEIGIKCLVLYLLFVCVASTNGYNFLVCFLLMLIFYLIDKKKDNQILVGLIIGLIFITKQNVGIFLFFPYFLHFKGKIKSIAIFTIPFLILCVYLVWNNAFFQFINYCFLGLFEFSPNKIFSCFGVWLLIMICLIFAFVKGKFMDKELLYIIFFQCICYPIFDFTHILVSSIPVIFYLLKNFNQKSIIVVLFIFSVIFFIKMGDIIFINIETDNNFMFLRNVSHVDPNLEEESKVISEYYDNYDNVFLISSGAYLRKLYMGIAINKYDLLNNGNMGYNGDEVYINEIDEICKNGSCAFFVDEIDWDTYNEQLSKKIYDYVVNNYEKISDNIYVNSFCLD